MRPCGCSRAPSTSLSLGCDRASTTTLRHWCRRSCCLSSLWLPARSLSVHPAVFRSCRATSHISRPYPRRLSGPRRPERRRCGHRWPSSQGSRWCSPPLAWRRPSLAPLSSGRCRRSCGSGSGDHCPRPVHGRAAAHPRPSARTSLRHGAPSHGCPGRLWRRRGVRGREDAVHRPPPGRDPLGGGISRALAVEPRVLVADEPVSSLDVSVQATILRLFEDLRVRLGLTMIFISHNLAVVRHLSNRVAVMYLGRIVEQGRRDPLFADARHPYTQALLAAAPRLHQRQLIRLQVKGEPPSPVDLPQGCRFHPRCPMAAEICVLQDPLQRPVREGDDHVVSCHFGTIRRARSRSARQGYAAAEPAKPMSGTTRASIQPGPARTGWTDSDSW